MNDKLRPVVSAVIALLFFMLLFFPLQFPPVLAGLIAVLLYIGLFFLLKPRRRIGATDVEDLKGGDENLTLMQQFSKQLKELTHEEVLVKEPDTKATVHDLSDTGEDILHWLEKHPDAIAGSSRFVNYYLKMAVNLTRKYNELIAADLDTPEFIELKKKTRDALSLLNKAFDHQLTRLTEGELMDISADISVLEKTIQIEDMK